MLKDVLNNKIWLISSAALLAIPIYTWKKLYTTYREEKRKYEEELLFHKRHNCVVMYCSSKGMNGWPPHTKRVKFNVKNQNMSNLLEPIVYFINTAKHSLDIAVMAINNDIILNAVIEACKRKVKVRLLLNYEHVLNFDFKPLKKEGAQILLFIPKVANLSSIMHYKYMLKDYSDSSGYVLMGSMNLTQFAALNNYEDLVFTSNEYVVESVHENFEECWENITFDNEDVYNKAMLRKLMKN